MNQTIHFLWGHPAAGCLAHGLREAGVAGHEVRVVTDDLSFGPLRDARARAAFLREEIVGESAEEALRDHVTGGPASWPAPADCTGREVAVWHSPNVIEQMMLRMVVYRLTDCRLFEIGPRGTGSQRQATAELSPEALVAMIRTCAAMSPGRSASLRADWERLRDAREPLRILRAGRIEPVAADSHDAQILARCTEAPRPAAQVIGEVLRDSEQVLSDTFISYRIRRLVENGCLAADGRGGPYPGFTVRAVAG